MKVNTWIKYYESYIPARCRKPRYEEKEEFIDVEIEEVSKRKLKLAFNDKSYEGKGKIYFYKNKLWYKLTKYYYPQCDEHEKDYNTPLGYLVYWAKNGSEFFPRECWDGEYPDRDKIIERVNSDLVNNHIIVDGELYEVTSEPAYKIVCFGLGGNHGGTGLFVDYPEESWANAGINYHYNALQTKEAMEDAKRTALGRGDTESLELFEDQEIKVYMPELVKLKAGAFENNLVEVRKNYEEE